MASISTSIPLIRFQSVVSLQPTNYNFKSEIFASGLGYREEGRLGNGYLKLNQKLNQKLNHYSAKREKIYLFKVCSILENSDGKGIRNEVEKEQYVPESENSVRRLRETVNSPTPVLSVMKKQIGTNHAVGLCIGVALLMISLRAYLIRNSASNHHGSVAYLVKRGQLRSDRRGIPRPLKYDDPFNNPLVKVSKNNSTVEMCGKVYRLAPVTLTKVEQSSHQKRRSRAYQWKRPTMFLKEGDSIPPDVDPDTVRWIPANHPFATTVNDIDEDLAQSNVYQKNGVPFRIKAEHEALQRKLETLQNEQKFNKLVIDPGNVRDFEGPFKPMSHEHAEEKASSNQGDNSSNTKRDGSINFSETTSFDELQKP